MTYRAVGWALGMVVVLYAMIWLVAGPPAFGAAPAPAPDNHANHDAPPLAAGESN